MKFIRLISIFLENIDIKPVYINEFLDNFSTLKINTRIKVKIK